MQKIRYPPFESDRVEPSGVPIIEVGIQHDEDGPPEFSIGNPDDWYVQWRDFEDSDSGMRVFSSSVYRDTPEFIKKSRFGWYIDPDPLHNVSRKLIYPTVIILILTLFIHAIEPVLVEVGLISEAIAGSFRFGPLEYPVLLIFSFPIFLMPLFFRTWANFRDFSKQNEFLNSPIANIDLEVEVSRESISINEMKFPDSVEPTRIRCQVGVAIPKRSAIDFALGRSEKMQPLPGMSTKLPAKRAATGDDAGTGVGEAMPMQASEKKMLMLEPMRIMESGEWTDIVDNGANTMSVPLPQNEWPGAIYSDLIAVHWELVIQCKWRNVDCKWVQPVRMQDSNGPIAIHDAPVKSGRVELSN